MKIQQFVLITIFICLLTLDFLLAQSKIDLNQASFEQLKSLPNIGESLAKKIIELRESKGGFNSIEELIEIKGIGKKKLEMLKQYLTVGEVSDFSSLNQGDEKRENPKIRIYRYIDERGTLHFTQFPELVPERYRHTLKPIN
ncbi:MAG: helix-hairpin-helix domain-containing protein [Thermodesulfobacteriaceae bacterium]|nr:helix-hairpin-helix domain-containing protein [Thermodesulfobacteriaceae bacterium]